MDFTREQIINGFEQALAYTFENLIFLEIEDSEVIEQLPEPDAETIITDIEITSPVHVGISLILSKEFGLHILNEMAGDEVEDTDGHLIKDATAEILNTLGGRFAAEIMPDTEFKLSLPDCRLVSSEKEELPKGEIRKYVMFDWELFVVLKLDDDLQ